MPKPKHAKKKPPQRRDPDDKALPPDMIPDFKPEWLDTRKDRQQSAREVMEAFEELRDVCNS